MDEIVASLVLYTCIVPVHEMLHYVSARERVVSVSIKPYGVFMRLKSLTLRDVLLPQAITLALLALFALTGRPSYLVVASAHLASSVLDFYSYMRVRAVKK